MTTPTPTSPPSLPVIDPADRIVGLERGLLVLESFDDAHGRQTVAQVTLRTGLPRSAVRRHLLTLCHLGHAATDGKLFWLTPRVLRLGQGYLEGGRLPRLVQPFIQRLSMAVGETVNVSVLDGHEVVYIARSNSPRLVSIGFHAGDRVPAHVVSPGVVLLSTLDDAALAGWLAEHTFGSYTSATPLQPEVFGEHVRQARLQGYWTSAGQLDRGLSGLAVALRDRHGQCKGAVGMTFQSAMWSDEAIRARLVPALQDVVQTLRAIV